MLSRDSAGQAAAAPPGPARDAAAWAAREDVPRICDELHPPEVLGAAALAEMVFAGAGIPEVMAAITARGGPASAHAYDTSLALQLGFRRENALSLLNGVLSRQSTFRVAGASPGALRVLALLAPGDLMVNTPIEFLARHLNIRLDLLYIASDRPLPASVPDHDVAFFAVSESDPAALTRLAPLFRAWPRPALNHPSRVSELARDRLAAHLTGLPGIHHPPTRRCDRASIEAALTETAPLRSLLQGADWPVLVRPVGSHGGAGLARADDAAALAANLAASDADEFYLCPFVDYRSPDGQFRKYRIVLIDGAPQLCHLAISSHWMVHYLSAGMASSAAKRAEESRAMADFAAGFAHRHAEALAALAQAIGLDYVVVDCAETRDGVLLVFEADVASIVHLLDPADLFPYKAVQMRKVFAAFESLLRGAARKSVN